MKVLMIVDNGIIGDSRVQKSAKSVADFGNEVLLLGRDLGNPDIPADMGSVAIARVPVDLKVMTTRKLGSPIITFRHLFAYRSELSADNAKKRLQMRKYAIKMQNASGKSALIPKFFERMLTLGFGFRYRQYSNAWKRHEGKVSLQNKIRIFLFNITRNPVHLFQISPSLYAFEAAYLQSALDFGPDVIHAHDFRMSGTGIRLADAIAKSGQKRPKVIYDAHEFLEGITGFECTSMKGFLLNEAEAAKKSDALITVSEEIATLLCDKYKLETKPYIVLNSPVVEPNSVNGKSLRKDCGVLDTTPLGVYLGGLAVKRGISPVLKAMVDIPELHFAFVANVTAYNDVFLGEAKDLGVIDRVHILPYVQPNEIVSYVSEASFGLAPYLHDINHEVSLPSKFYEYACAGLPIVGSDVKVVKHTIEKFGIGEVFVAGDSATLAIAIQKLIGDLDSYKRNYANAPTSTWSWSAQEDVLREAYKSLS